MADTILGWKWDGFIGDLMRCFALTAKRSPVILAFHACRTYPHIGDIELFGLPMLLHPVGKIKGVIQFEALEHIKPSAQSNLPAMVRCNVAVMFCA